MNIITTEQQTLNRSERRRLQRTETKKWRKEEKKMMKIAPNGGNINRKKSRRVAPITSSNTIDNNKKTENHSLNQSKERNTQKEQNTFNQERQADENDDELICQLEEPIVQLEEHSIQTEESPIKCEEPVELDIHTNDNIVSNNAYALENSISEISKAHEEEQNIKHKELIYDFSTVEDAQIYQEDKPIQNVAVTEVPGLEKLIDDKIDETLTNVDTYQEEEDKKEVIADEENIVTLDTTTPIAPVMAAEQIEKVQEMEPVKVVESVEKAIPVKNMASVEDFDTSVHHQDVVPESLKKAVPNTNIEHPVSVKEMLSFPAIIDKRAHSSAKTTSTMTVSKTFPLLAKSSRKRSIMSRLFKNNQVEIKQKSQEKLIAQEPTEKKKTKPWQLWKMI